MHFLLSLCYTEPAGCMEPTNVLIRVCILLLMQPAPLAGTATKLDNQHLSWLQDATRTPRGDGNLIRIRTASLRCGCNPHPSRGRQHSFKAETETCLHRDATRTPYGDGNLRILDLHLVAGRCNPHPLRGRQLIEPFILEFDPPMQPAPLAGTVTRSK